MSQPPAYNRSFSFTNFQSTNPSAPIPGSQVDLELNNVKSTLDGTRANLAQIQRDDGALKNGSVTFDTLSPALQTAGLAPALPWVVATAYQINASVTHGSAFYRCLTAHTSGVFATDLAVGKWVLIVDFSTIALVAASLISVTPSGVLTSDVQTSLQALDTGKAATSHTHPSSAISDSTAAGRALLTAADVAAQNALLGTAVLGFQPGDIKETACPILQSGWYYCDGSTKSRVTDVNLFNAITIQQSGVLTSASPVVTGLSDTSNMSPGMPLSGTGIADSTFIQSVDSGTQITMTANATASSTTQIVVAPYGIGDGSTTFNLPNRAYVGIGRDNASGSASNLSQISTTISTTNGSVTATIGSAAAVAVGMFISHPKVPFGTTITAISGTTITMSAAATGTVAGSAVRLSPIADAQTIGRHGGGIVQSTTLVTANLPPYTPAGSITNGAITITGSGTAAPAGIFSDITPGSVQGAAAGSLGASQAASTFAGAAQGGTSAPIVRPNMQPTIVMNIIIKR